MNTSEKFLRFAAECEFMAEYTHISRTKLYGVRWLRGGYIALNCLIANAPRHTTVVPQSKSKTRSQLGSLTPGEAEAKNATVAGEADKPGESP